MKTGIFSLIILVMIMFACKKEQDETPHFTVEKTEQYLDLGDEIIGTPPELVSITSKIEIEFRNDVIPEHLGGTTLDENPFSFEPATRGVAHWISTRILRFEPDTNLPAGVEVKGKLIGKIAFGQQKNVNDFTFSFKVAEQEIIKLEGDFVAAPNQKNTVIYKGTLFFAQPVSNNEVNNSISLKGPEGNVKISLQQSDDSSKEIQFRSSPIVRSKKGKSFVLSLPGDFTADKKEWKKNLYLPGIDIFRVLAHMDATEETSTQPVYAFRFSDPIKKDSDLSGFIDIQPEIKFHTRIQGKYLYIEGDFTPGRFYSITISKGFPSVFGTKLSAAYVDDISFNNIKPELKWLSKGIFLPESNVHKLQFKSVNVGRASVRVMEIQPKNVGFFIQRNAIVDRSSESESQYGYYYRSFDYLDLDRVAEEIFTDTLQITDQINKWIYSELDLSSVFRGRPHSVFVIQLLFGRNDLTGRCVNSRDDLSGTVLYYEDDDYYNNPCQHGYYYSRGRKSKLLISSNIGITAKKSDEGIHVYLTEISTAKPLTGVSLQLYNYQNRILASRTTTQDGHALFPDQGFYIFGESDQGMALLKLNHKAWELNTFEVSGGSGGKKGTDVFAYLDRGIHRPGDTVHYSAIVRSNRKAPPEKQPVLLKVKNPKGQTVFTRRANAGPTGHVYWPIPTSLTDPTGTWTARLETSDQVFMKTMKIETIKPNRLKIAIDVPAQLSARERYLSGKLKSSYLFGAPGAGLKCRIRLNLLPAEFNPGGYPEYTFSSPLKKFRSRNLTIFNNSLDLNGEHVFNYQLPGLSNAPGTVKGQMQVTVYERGGSFTEKKKSITVNPFISYTGIKNVFKHSRAKLGENYSVPIVVIDQDGDPVSGHKLKVNIYVNRRNWWWDYDRRDQRDFRQMESTYLVHTTSYTSEIKPLQHKIVLEDYGRHFMEVIDETSGHEAGLFFSVSRWGTAISGEETERNFIQVNTDKNIYNPGDIATINFESPEAGSAFLSIEQGNKILSSEWVELENTQTNISFPVTADMVPNCYASIRIIQPHNQTMNDVPLRTYGIKPIYVEDKNSHLQLSVEAPQVLNPKESFEVAVTSSAGVPASYTIAIVDDGLLDITAFETPSPWDYYFQKLRLGVVTLDNFDEILGVLFPDISRFFSIGGGDLEDLMMERLDRTAVRRFKPVVLFSEPQLILPGEINRTPFTMANYVGSVRLMVIGSAGHSYTSLDKTIPVRQELMILPTIPRVIRPGDSFSLPVSVFSMDSTITSATVSLNTSANLEISGSATSKVRFQGVGEKDTRFGLLAGQNIGKTSISLAAEAGSFSADYSTDLSISASNPYYTEVLDTMISAEKSITLIPRPFGYNGTNKAKLAFSRLPDIQLEKRFSYLLRYPYGCIEQTTSAGFAQLFLPSLVELKAHQKQAVTDNINAAITKLSRFQVASGFSFWPVSENQASRYSEWGTNYAGHFLITARALGYHVPPAVYNHWLNDAQRNAKKINEKNYRYQTYRLFLLALSENPNMGAMNLVRENHLDKLDALSIKFLAASYHLSGQTTVATQINAFGSAQILDYREMGGTYGSLLRDQALMVYLCLLMEDQQTAARLLKRVSAKIRPSGWYSTQETAIALLAIGTYYKTVPFSGGAITFDLELDGKRESIKLSGYQTTYELDNQWEKEIKIISRHQDPLFISLVTEGIPIKDIIKTEHKGITIKRKFYNEQGYPVSVDHRKQGDDFWVVYTVSSIFNEDIEELALSSIFPSGWEIINPRVSTTAPPPWIQKMNISKADFMDIRDDRINWFFNLKRNQKVTFALKLNPTFNGRYHLPPVVCESMYSPDFYARIASGKVTVD